MTATSHHHLLLVEDHADTIEFMVLRLERAGYGVRIARTGQEALAKLEGVDGQLPDLVLMDMHLPGMSGLEIYRTLRANQRTAKVPVLFLSATSPDQVWDLLQQDPHAGWLEKGFRFERLQEAMRKLLS